MVHRKDQQRPLGVHLGENADIFRQRQAALEQIALQNGCLFAGKPSVSKLIKRLADGKLIVVAPPEAK